MSKIKLQGNSSGTGTTTLQSANTSSNTTFTLPGTDGTNGQGLVTDGSGTLSFATVGGTTSNALTMNNGGSGDASGTTFNGSAARTISYNTIGAVPLNGALGTPSSGTLSSCTVDGTNSVGFRTAPQTSGGASAYTLVLTDSGKHVIFTGGSTATLTVPTNSSVAFHVGTTILVVNDNSGNLTISGAGVTFQLANGSTGNRTVATKGLATCLKTATDTWYVSGAGVT
jgi:hypothetical protein